MFVSDLRKAILEIQASVQARKEVALDLQRAKEATMEAVHLATRKRAACEAYQEHSSRLIEMMSEMVKNFFI
jgi:hypothetical protein